MNVNTISKIVQLINTDNFYKAEVALEKFTTIILKALILINY